MFSRYISTIFARFIQKTPAVLLWRISESGATEVRISESVSPQGFTRPKHYYMRKGIFFSDWKSWYLIAWDCKSHATKGRHGQQGKPGRQPAEHAQEQPAVTDFRIRRNRSADFRIRKPERAYTKHTLVHASKRNLFSDWKSWYSIEGVSKPARRNCSAL